MVAHFKNQGIRTSILWIVVAMIEGAGKTRWIELYTRRLYARLYATDKQKPLLLYTSSAKATDLGIGIKCRS
jgi:hypothetical protein